MEVVKSRSRHLRGSIAAELREDGPSFSPDTALTLKFHGIYAQDDRDSRARRRAQGLAPDVFHMVRTGIPGGCLTAAQYLVLDKLADVVGDGTLRVTTRQDVQFHRVYKSDLSQLIHTLNDHLVTTLAACGDVARNTTACPAPLPGGARDELADWARKVSQRFKPQSPSYYDIWIGGDQAVTAGPGRIAITGAEEPLYGQTYLPRKFKVGFCAPHDNCTDVLINDLAVVPRVENGLIRAFTVCIGGGQGKSHNRPHTYPRLATPVTTVQPAQLLDLCRAVIELHRDHGDRVDRSHARLKYLIDDLGIPTVRGLVADYLGQSKLDEPEPVELEHADDHLGWHEQGDGRWFVGVKVANGRIGDRGSTQIRSGLRAVVEQTGASVRFTAREDALLCDIDEGDRQQVEGLLDRYGVRPVEEWVPVSRNSFACPALPTCGLALAESERTLPALLEELDTVLTEVGLGELDVHVRMTGCPNGCARPYTTEVAFVGRGRDRYDIHLGGDQIGTRLNEVFCENVPRDSLVAALRPVFVRFHEERSEGDRFGNWCQSTGVAALRAELGTERWVRTSRTSPQGSSARP